MSELNPEHLLTTAQVADLLKVSPSTVNRYARNGTLPAEQTLPGVRGARLYKAGTLVAFHEANVEATK